MKCRICKQNAGWIYPIISLTGWCVHCSVEIDIRRTSPPSEEWEKEDEISKKAVDKWLKDNGR